MARRLAVVMSQAPGLSGTPDSGHCSSAATSASWARSSARPTSRTIRARPAMSRADSILQIASIVRWVAEAVTATDYTILDSPVQAEPRLPLRGRLRADALLLLAELGGERGTEVLRLEHLANLHLGVLEGGPLEPFDRLFPRLHLPQPEAGDQLLRLGERSVDHRPLSPGELDAHPLRTRVQPLAGEHDTRLHQLLVELPHLGQDLRIGENACLRLLAGFHKHHESHRQVSSGFRSEPGSRPTSTG